MDWNQLITPLRFQPDRSSTPRVNDRSQFQRDYDRLIFSSPFRRLQNKTQVFPLPGHIFVHNRLTHSLEVASVGRSLGNAASTLIRQRHHDTLLHPEWIEEIGTIVSSACLAHDLGNPPFGHSGEEAFSFFFSSEGKKYREMVSEKEWLDLTHFEGNANTFRLLTHNFHGRRPGGYIMTYSTLAAAVKYPFECSAPVHGHKFGFFQSELPVFKEVAEVVGLRPVSTNPLCYTRHPLVYLVEAADDICYQIMDIEDAHKLKILTHEETLNLLRGYFDPDKDREELDYLDRTLQTLTDLNEQIAFIRAGVINRLSNACAEVFANRYDEIMEGNFDGTLMTCLPYHLQRAQNHCSEVSLEKIYRAGIVTQIQIAGFKIIGTLLKEYTDAVMDPDTFYAKNILSVMPKQYAVDADASTYARLQSVIDYVSGMTDSYALNLYRNINGIEVPELR